MIGRPPFGGGLVEGEDAVVVGRALEEGGENHHPVGAVVGGVAGAGDHVLDEEGGGLDDHLGAASDDPRAGGEVLLQVRLEGAEVDPAGGVEGRGDGEVEAGERETGHGQRLSAPERSSQIVLSWVYWSWAWTELSRPPKPDWR